MATKHLNQKTVDKPYSDGKKEKAYSRSEIIEGVLKRIVAAYQEGRFCVRRKRPLKLHRFSGNRTTRQWSPCNPLQRRLVEGKTDPHRHTHTYRKTKRFFRDRKFGMKLGFKNRADFFTQVALERGIDRLQNPVQRNTDIRKLRLPLETSNYHRQTGTVDFKLKYSRRGHRWRSARSRSADSKKNEDQSSPSGNPSETGSKNFNQRRHRYELSSPPKI